MKVHSWDEVSGEIWDFEAPDDASPVEVYDLSNKIADYEPSGEYDRWEWVELPGVNIIAGRWGRDKHLALWWGPQANTITKLFQKELNLGEI